MDDLSLIIEHDDVEGVYYVSSESKDNYVITYGKNPEEAINRFFEVYSFVSEYSVDLSEDDLNNLIEDAKPHSVTDKDTKKQKQPKKS